MVHECFPSPCFYLPEGPFQRPIFQLDDKTEFSILLLTACLKRSGRAAGPEQHLRLREFIQAGIGSESDLQAWIETSLDLKLSRKAWESCLQQAGRWRAERIRVFGWHCPGSVFHGQKMTNDIEPATKEGSTTRNLPCPAVLFGKGGFDVDRFQRPWLAVFNSRKPRSIAPDAPWLEALRSFLKNPGIEQAMIATGAGTLTYDMVGLYAVGSKLPHVLVKPFSLLQPGSALETIYGDTASGIPALSCMLETNDCSARQRLLCRDWILAALSQIHLVLEVRSKGNLAAVLEKRQRSSPAVQIIYAPAEKKPSNSGNFSLLKNFPESARAFKTVHSACLEPVRSADINNWTDEVSSSEAVQIEWSKYLYHYTRTCAGPWPGETYRKYLAGLLAGNPLCAHTAIDTLIRILLEDRIRASSSAAVMSVCPPRPSIDTRSGSILRTGVMSQSGSITAS